MAKNWIPKWLQNDEDESAAEETRRAAEAKSKELPPEIEARFRKIDEVDSKLGAMDERLKSLDSIVAYFDEDKREKAAAKAKAANNDDESDDPARLLADPKGFIAESTKSTNELVLQLRADNIKKEVFEDSESFPYYTGDIKREIDSVLEKQDLRFRNSSEAVANTYHTVVGKHMKEINDGKIKTRFASTSQSINSSKDSGEDVSFEITPDITKAAKLSGMEVDDYMKLLKKAAKAGEVEYV